MTLPRFDPQTFLAHRRNLLQWMLATPLVGCGHTPDRSAVATVPNEDGAAREAVREADGGVTLDDSGATCRSTSSDAKGPYYEAGAPSRSVIASPAEPGVRLAVEGTLFGPDCRGPLAGYIVDVWQADAKGTYYEPGDGPYRLRGKVTTDANGQYRFETILPGRYGDAAGIRPAHVHVSIHTPLGNTLLTTQLYFEGDPYLGEADYCTRGGACNSSDDARILKLDDATIAGTLGKRAVFDAFLART